MEIFADTLEKHSAYPILFGADFNPISNHEAVKLADEIAGLIRPREILIQITSNTVSSILGYIGFLRNRSIPILLPEVLKNEFLLKIVNQFQPGYIWAPSSFEISGIEFTERFRYRDYVLLKLPTASDVAPNPELALLLPTSGSTGNPEMVRISYKNLTSNAQSIIDYLKLDETSRAITTLPMNYSFGLSIINTHLASKGSLVVNTFSVAERGFWNLVHTFKPTHFAGVPYTYQILKRFKSLISTSLSLEVFLQAGGKLDSKLVLEFCYLLKSVNKSFYVMYGQTEATARMTYLPINQAILKPSSIGRAIPGGRVILIEEDGSEVNHAGSTGELVYFGPNVSLGYAKSREELALGDSNYGRLFTGDLAIKDNDGDFYIVGRKNRIGKVFGIRVNLQDLEDHLSANEVEAVCISLENQLKICTTSSVEKMKITTIVSKYLGVSAAGLQVLSIDAFPRSPSGKISYSELEQVLKRNLSDD